MKLQEKMLAEISNFPNPILSTANFPIFDSMIPANSNNTTLEATKIMGTGAINNITAHEIRIGKMDPSAMLRAGSGHYVEAGFDAFVLVHRALDAAEV